LYGAAQTVAEVRSRGLVAKLVGVDIALFKHYSPVVGLHCDAGHLLILSWRARLGGGGWAGVSDLAACR
jgi:hypothetical protein